MKIIQQAWTEEVTHRYMVFTIKGGSHGSGFSFECDEHGNIREPKAEAGRENLRKCLSGEHDVYKPRMEIFTSRYRHPRIGLCDCGAEVSLGNFTNTCECGADYNMSGHRLAPRECWGEETGEHWTECL